MQSSSPSEGTLTFWIRTLTHGPHGLQFEHKSNPKVAPITPPFQNGQVSLYLTPCGAHEAEEGPLDMSHKTRDLHLGDEVGIETLCSCGMILSD